MKTKEQLLEEIKAEAKVKGLDLAEKNLEEIADFAFMAVGKVVAWTENKYDDMIFGAVEGKAKEMLADMIDKVDGKEG